MKQPFLRKLKQVLLTVQFLNLTDREAIIEIGGKSEGVISLNEFRYNPELKVGDTVEVLIDQQEDKTGTTFIVSP